MGWELGLVAGMADAGTDLREADLFVGTSAGALVAAQITGVSTLDEAFRLVTSNRAEEKSSRDQVDFTRWREAVAKAKAGGGTHREILRRIGLLTKLPPAKSEEEERQNLASQLPTRVWPKARLLIAAVDVQTGERCVFDRDSGISLVDAVLASGAVAGIDAPLVAGGHVYVDGGFYSTDNADLAVGCDRILILALRARVPRLSLVPLEAATDKLRASGALVEIVLPDEASEGAFASVGGNLLNPAVLEPAMNAGRWQGRRLASERIARFWQ